jgi:putative transposase
MSRIARVVVTDVPHHVTQRGNYQQTVFSESKDRELYLRWIEEYSDRCELKIWAYCLMDNHVHFIVVPKRPDSMARTFNQAHMRYSQYFNWKMGKKGHLWQGRFYSCPLDEGHLYAAVRYVENNPVRAGFVERAEDYPWSSARNHMRTQGVSSPVLSEDLSLLEEITDWQRYLAAPDEAPMIERIRKCTLTGRPAGSDSFTRKIERLLGRSLVSEPVGRPRKTKQEE